jgi:hypothetical protein
LQINRCRSREVLEMGLYDPPVPGSPHPASKDCLGNGPFDPGDGKEKRKISVLSLQAIDSSIKYGNLLHGYFKPFPRVYFRHTPNEINDFDHQMLL